MMYKYNKEKLDYEKVSLRKLIATIAIGIILLVLLSSFIAREVVFIQAEKELVLRTNNSFSKENLVLEVSKYSFKYPDIVIAQAIVESSHFKSPVFKENNNLFGMREAVVRINVAQGSNLNHATYRDWKDCVIDRALYEAQYLSKLSREEYFNYLDQSYAEGKGYSQLLKKIIIDNKLNTN